MKLANYANAHSVLRILRTITFISILPLQVCGGQAPNACIAFEETIKATYNFRPALLSDSERAQKSAEMDEVWKTVKSRRELLPCLSRAVDDPHANDWFRFDGSNLLVSLDPSQSAKVLQVRNYSRVNLDDVDLRVWVSTLARRGAEGFDTAEAGERWLSFTKATYYLPENGAFQVDKLLGGMFIFGSMDERQATPALIKIAGLADHPGRETALSLLLMQATPESISGLKTINQAGLSVEARAVLRQHLAHPILIAKRPRPKTGREQFRTAFDAFVSGDEKPFATLVRDVPDGERDVVAVLKAEDLPLVRRVRRLMIANANPHVAEYYVTFTQILATMISQPQLDD